MRMITMLKNPVVLVACTLLVSSLAVLASKSSFGPEECCFTFISKPLMKKRVVNYKYTDDECPMEGVLFTTLSNREMCADPSAGWVQKVITALEEINDKRANRTALHS